MPQLLRRGSSPIFTRLIQVVDDSTACRQFIRIRLQRRLNACFALLAMLLGSAAHGVTISSFTPASGPVGTTVTINGSGYDALAGTYVKFNGAARVSATVISANQLTVVVPGSASTGVIKVTVGYRNAATSQTPFTVTTGPTITSFSPTSGAVGTPVTINGSGFSATPSGDTVTFNGTAAVVGSNSTVSTIYATVPTGAASGPIGVTVSGLSTTSTNSFMVLAPPNAPGAVTVPSTSSSTSVAVSWTPGGGGTPTYYELQRATAAGGPWTSINTAITTTSFTDTVPGNGTYYYEVAACNTIGCSGYTSSSGGVQVQIPAPSCASEAPIASTVPSTASTQRIYAFGVQNATMVYFPTWWIAGANPNWLPGTNAGNGTWYVDVQLAQFDTGNPHYGNFETDVYLFNNSYSNIWCGGGSWARNGAAQGSTGGEAYIYDANSRLTYLSAATATDSYGYDPLGNILSINQSEPPTITSIAPAQGLVGTQVTIHGGPFPPAASFASFNGGPAVPTTIMGPNDLVATVPVGSNTGYVALTLYDSNPPTVMISPTIFTVLPSSPDTQGAQPLIAGFSPASGAQGTSVTVTGSNFNPVSGQTVVSLGSTQATVSSISDTQIVFTVPAAQGTGNIYVTTPYGTAQSATSFVVPVSTTPALNPIVPLTLNGGAQSLTLSSSSACGAYTFGGQAGSWISLQLSSLTASATVNWMLFGPNNQPVMNLNNATFNQSYSTFCGQPVADAVIGNVSSSNMSVHLPPLPSTGGYTLVLNSSSSTAVSMAAALVADPVVAQGGTITTSISGAYQSQRVQFTDTTGQLVVDDVTTLSVSPSSGLLSQLAVSAMGVPQGTQGPSAGNGQTSVGVSSAGSTTGGILLTGSSGATGSAQVLLDTSAAGTATTDGSSVSINQTISGKATRVVASLTGGQAVTLALTNVSTLASAVLTELFDPNGNLVTGSTCTVSSGTGNCSWDLSGTYYPIPMLSGNYTFVLIPQQAYTYSASFTVSSDLAANLSPGVPTTINLHRPGQTERLSFTGTGNPALINVLNSTGSPTGEGIWAWTYDSNVPTQIWQGNGTNLYGMLYWSGTNNGQPITVQLAPGNQNVSPIFGQGNGGTGSANVLVDETIQQATINPYGATNPASTLVSTSYPGQGAQVEFSNPSNWSYFLTLSNVTTSNGTAGVQVIAFYNDPGIGWGEPYQYIGYCAVSQSPCTFSSVFNPYGNTFPTMLVLLPNISENVSPSYGIYANLPYSQNLTFSANVTLEQQ